MFKRFGMMYTTWDNVGTQKRGVRTRMKALLEAEGDSWFSVVAK